MLILLNCVIVKMCNYYIFFKKEFKQQIVFSKYVFKGVLIKKKTILKLSLNFKFAKTEVVTSIY